NSLSRWTIRHSERPRHSPVQSPESFRAGLIRFFRPWAWASSASCRCTRLNYGTCSVRYAPPETIGADGCPLAEEVGSGRFCPAFTRAAWMAMDPDCRRHSWRCLTCRRVQRGAVAEPILVGQLDRWVYADQSDEAADGVAAMAGEMLVPGAVALVRSPAGEISTTYG